MNLERLDWVLAKAQESADLTDWEADFIDDMVNRRERYGDRITISDRQEEILERIARERT